MKKAIAITCFLILLNFGLDAQEKPVTAKLSLKEVPFTEFAAKVLDCCDIRIYYKPEWVVSVRITAEGDNIDINELLNKTLNPLGINFYYRGNGQFFLTGSAQISTSSAVKTDNMAGSGKDTANLNPRQDYFKRITYEKTIKNVVIGIRGKSQESRQCYLSGRITNRSNGEPVAGASVSVTGTANGVISDSEGSYSLPLQSGRNFKITASCLGMDPQLFAIDMNSSGVLNIELDSKLIDVREVTVTSDRFQNVRGMQMGFQSITAKDMKSIPMVMGERDIFKVANLMPGVQTVGEGSAGFNVRGSASDQNLFLINEIPVLNTGHLFGFFSAFNPDMVNGLNLYKSNFPVEYGGRLASIFDISTRKGNKKDFGARGSLSPITGSLLLETPIVKDKVSLMFSARSTYSDWILNKLKDAELNKRQGSFYDLMTGVHILGKDGSSLQVFGYYSKDKFSLSGTNQYRYSNLGGSMIYDRRLGDKWTMKAAAVVSNYSNFQANNELASKSFEHEFRVRSQELKIKFIGYPIVRHKIGLGGNVILHNLDQGILNSAGGQSLFSPIDFGKESGLEYAVHASDEFSVTENFTIYGGLRYSFFNYLGANDIRIYPDNVAFETKNIIDTVSYGFGKTIKTYSGPEYRVSLNYQINKDLSLKASYNKMRQYLFMLSNTIAISPTDRWKLVDPYIAPPVADQFSLGTYKNFNNSSIETSAEVYYKSVKNIIEYKDRADLTFSPDVETLVLQGDQKAWGVEFLVKKNSGRLTGWISYTWSRSMITVNGLEPWQKINNGITYPANYDKPHALNVVASLKISRRVSLSSTIVYNTGRPITYPTGFIYVGGVPVINYSLRNEYRIPDYFRTDLALTIEGNLRKKKFAHGSWVVSVYNLTGRKNAYSIYFVQENLDIKGYKLSIYGVPIFTISYQFKLGNYAVE
jgi:hypothetical protein